MITPIAQKNYYRSSSPPPLEESLYPYKCAFKGEDNGFEYACFIMESLPWPSYCWRLSFFIRSKEGYTLHYYQDLEWPVISSYDEILESRKEALEKLKDILIEDLMLEMKKMKKSQQNTTGEANDNS